MVAAGNANPFPLFSQRAYLNHDQKYFLNRFYQQGEGALDGICTNLRFWKGYYLRYHEHKSEEDNVKYEHNRLGIELEQMR